MLTLTRRFISVIKSTLNARCLSLLDNHLQIENGSAEPIKFHYLWLRDHCRCSECYNYKTHQINSDILQIPSEIRPKECEEISDKLNITWHDGHRTEFSVEWLKKLVENRRKSLNETIFWNVETIQNCRDTAIPYDEYYGKPEGLKRLLKSILKYGIGFVTQVEPTLEATEKVVKFMSPVKRTIFGEMWEVTNDLNHADTAYSTIALGPHTDNTYFTEASGLQVFHMLQHDGQGGETLLVDGFNAANNIKNKVPGAFDVLTTFPIESEYIEEGIHFTCVDPVIKLHPITKNLFQIRYNIYDRAPLNSLTYDDIPKFYTAYKALGNEINADENKWWLKLQPGTVIFIDNWRVMHGRASYSGLRKMTGCYVGRKEWLSTAKHVGLPLY